jgi:predicted nucleic acid-binding protein
VRIPSGALVVDASILIAAVLGRASAAILLAAQTRDLVVTARAVDEAARRVELGLKAPKLVEVLHALVADFNVVNALELEERLPEAETVLIDAVASRNGSTADAHILACAWAAKADIWSTDRDFAGTGVASWSTANLMRALAAENA